MTNSVRFVPGRICSAGYVYGAGAAASGKMLAERLIEGDLVIVKWSELSERKTADRLCAHRMPKSASIPSV
jgi:hypothetical protein